MRPRTELALFAGLLACLIGLVAALGTRNRPRVYSDPRASSYSTEPLGAQGLADALEVMGVKVVRLRRPRPPVAGLQSPERIALAVLDPPTPLSPLDASSLVGSDPVPLSLVLAGTRTRRLMRCFGFDTSRERDSLPIALPDGGGPAWVRQVLRPIPDREIVDSSRAEDTGVFRCRVAPVAAAETLLVTQSGRLAAIRLRLARPDRSVTLVADADLVRNRALKQTGAGPLVLGWFARHDQIWFDEYHQGYGGGGSLGGAVFRWSVESPWGWLGWQLAAAGLLALLTGAVRFGPAVELIERRRRSSIEQVRALAAALRTAGGHGLAVGLMVDGLRRRLSAAGAAGGRRTQWREWLAGLGTGARTRTARDIAARLDQLGQGRPGERQVLEAANLVEDMWTELRS
jgi:hypothetical protein